MPVTFFHKVDGELRYVREDCATLYRHDYLSLFRDIAEKEVSLGKDEGQEYKRSMYRKLVREDLFFLVCFVMGIDKANHPFVVTRCKEVEDGPATNTLDVWAREHFKTQIISVGETIQHVVRDPESTHIIFSYKKGKAEEVVDAIRNVLQLPLMRWLFPEILYDKPSTDSPSWSLERGLLVKRKSVGRKELTVQSAGLIEGMPTGGHWERRVYDDVETMDLAKNPSQLGQLIDAFAMSRNLGTDGGTERVIGTYYSHNGLLCYLRDKKRIDGTPAYHARIIPATDDGTITGAPVFLSQERLDELKADPTFNSQQLCNPLPSDSIRLDFNMLRELPAEFLPQDCYKFMVIDQAGDAATQNRKGKGDLWAIGVFAVKPEIDDLGASDVYLIDLMAERFRHDEAMHAIVQMYLRNGLIRQVGVEKVGLSQTEGFIASALRAHGRHISIETNTLVLLKPDSRSLEQRVEGNLAWPLSNGKLWYLSTIPFRYVEIIKREMQGFPYYHVDVMNMWAYLFDMLKEYRFPRKHRPIYTNYPRRFAIT